MLDDARWPAAAARIVEACGVVGSELVVAEGPGDDVDVLLAWFYHGARRREDLEREYFEVLPRSTTSACRGCGGFRTARSST